MTPLYAVRCTYSAVRSPLYVVSGFSRTHRYALPHDARRGGRAALLKERVCDPHVCDAVGD